MKTISKKQLAIKYGINYKTLRSWLSMIPELELDKRKRLLTPKQLEIIFEKIGIPNKNIKCQYMPKR
jgi:hypothetical protein